MSAFLAVFLSALGAGLFAGDDRKSVLVPGVHTAFQAKGHFEAGLAQFVDGAIRGDPGIADRDDRLRLVELRKLRIEVIETNVLRADNMAPAEGLGAAKIDYRRIVVDELDGRAGLDVVRILACAQESIAKDGQRIRLAQPT